MKLTYQEKTALSHRLKMLKLPDNKVKLIINNFDSILSKREPIPPKRRDLIVAIKEQLDISLQDVAIYKAALERGIDGIDIGV